MILSEFLENKPSAFLTMHLLMYLIYQLTLTHILLVSIFHHRLIYYFIGDRFIKSERIKPVFFFAAKSWTFVSTEAI